MINYVSEWRKSTILQCSRHKSQSQTDLFPCFYVCYFLCITTTRIYRRKHIPVLFSAPRPQHFTCEGHVMAQIIKDKSTRASWRAKYKNLCMRVFFLFLITEIFASVCPASVSLLVSTQLASRWGLSSAPARSTVFRGILLHQNHSSWHLCLKWNIKECCGK